jgi:hypothetical protein
MMSAHRQEWDLRSHHHEACTGENKSIPVGVILIFRTKKHVAMLPESGEQQTVK